MPAERPLLLLINAGAHRYREYLFASMHTRYRIHLLSMTEPTWERPYLAGCTVLADLDTADVVTEARRLAASDRVAGVMSWDESKILQAAHAARDLGLPGGDPEAILRCRDKFATRQTLDGTGVAQPAYELVGELDAALAAAERIGYPVVLKPRAASASFGVVLADGPEQLAASFHFPHGTTVPHMPRYDLEVLVEQYLPDPEFSVDAVVYQGRVVPLFLARKEIGFPPYFEETGHYVSHEDPLLRDPALVAALETTHAALGFTDGWTHVEFKLTDDGPKLIEINGRLGGDLIPYVGMLASGIDPGLAAAAAACGEEPVVTANRRLFGGVRFFYVDHDDTVIGSVDFDAGELPPGIDLAVPLVQPGDVVSRPPRGIVFGRVAFATAVAESQGACRRALDGAQAALRLRSAVSVGGTAE